MRAPLGIAQARHRWQAMARAPMRCARRRKGGLLRARPDLRPTACKPNRHFDMVLVLWPGAKPYNFIECGRSAATLIRSCLR
eukprot:7322730-Pyramimonas_sp.AAC.1